jgi:alpha-glucosidase
MVGELRQFVDNYSTEKGGDMRILITEAYSSVDDTAKYYADEEGKPRAHFPLNFVLIESLNQDSNAYYFKNEIDVWLSQVPIGAASSWVVS